MLNTISTKPNYIGRFAPSPTGPLHFGSLVACLASYLDAKAHGGKWLVRVEDIDTTRCQASIAQDILQTLIDLGFKWDGDVEYQRARTQHYQIALDSLSSRRLTYACACTRREIADSAVAGIDGPVYPGTCFGKSLAETGHAIRFHVSDGSTTFVDRLQGPQQQDVSRDIGDFVLRRRDGIFSYQLAVVVDDAMADVTHVVRGADLLDSTARQIALQRVLGFSIPSYLHIPVVTNEQGQKLSKQTLAPGVGAAEAGTQLRAALAFLGQSAQDQTLEPKHLLAHAVRNWNPAAIPAVRSSHIW